MLGPDIKLADAMIRTCVLDNGGVVGLQRQIIRDNILYYVLIIIYNPFN